MIAVTRKFTVFLALVAIPICVQAEVYDLPPEGNDVVGALTIVTARADDTLLDIARRHGLGYEDIVRANPDVDTWLPGEGTAVTLPTRYVLPHGPRNGVVLNLAEYRLYYYPTPEEGQPAVVMTYPISIGRMDWETPLGRTTIISKVKDPAWYPPASIRAEHAADGDPLPRIVPAGPQNPLGKYAMRLGLPGYLIHGTNQPYGVGMRVSHGCVRLYPENIELLYELVGLGESVMIINEPYLAGQRDGEIYFEGHTPLEDDKVSGEEHLQTIFAALQTDDIESPFLIDQEQVRAIAAEAFGVPVRIQQADSTEVMARARVIRNTVEPDPNMPTLEEVRALLDEPLEEEGAGEQVAVDE